MSSPPFEPGTLLGISAAVSFVMQGGFFIFAYSFQTDKGTDFAYGLNFFAIAIITLIVQGDFTVRSIIASVLVMLWAIRLAGYLFFRIHAIGSDNRFDKIRSSFWKFGAFWLFQFIVVFIVTLSYIFIMTFDDPTITAFDIIGWIIFLLGLLIEGFADQQKFSFKQKNKNDFCNIGLWKYSRHPNYYGEMLCWIGMYVSGIGNYSVAGYIVGLFSPFFISIFLIFLTGVNLLEPKADKRYGDREDYREYKQKTSILVLLPRGCGCAFPSAFADKSNQKASEESYNAESNTLNGSESNP